MGAKGREGNVCLTFVARLLNWCIKFFSTFFMVSSLMFLKEPSFCWFELIDVLKLIIIDLASSTLDDISRMSFSISLLVFSKCSSCWLIRFKVVSNVVWKWKRDLGILFALRVSF